MNSDNSCKESFGMNKRGSLGVHRAGRGIGHVEIIQNWYSVNVK